MRFIPVLVLLLVCAGYVVTVERRLAQIEIHLMEAGTQYHVHYSAPLPGTTAPVKREVTTKRNSGESVADWNDRHDAAVAALRAAYPPV